MRAPSASSAFVVGWWLALLVGCKDKGDSIRQGGPAPAAAATSPSVAVTQATFVPPRYTRFKVTSAKPADVEDAMHQGWTLVNCSWASQSNHAGFGGVLMFGGEHCYFVGNEPSVGNDAGSGY